MMSLEDQTKHVEDLRKLLELNKLHCNCPENVELPRCKEFCTSFIDLPLVSEKGESCPCNQIGEDAIILTHLAIEAWDNGEHKWQKERNEVS